MITMPAVFDMLLSLPYWIWVDRYSRFRAHLEVEFAAAHEKITFGIGTNVLALLIH